MGAVAAKTAVVNGTAPPDTSLLGTVRRRLCASEAAAVTTTFALVLLIGVPLGIAFPPSDPSYPDPWRRLSGVIGYIYFTAWSISFYPQVLINWYRKSVVGLAFEYQVLNLLGFSCYTAYNAGLYWNDAIRAEYVAANGSLPSVESNDVFFAIHAVLLTLIVLIQICIYDRGGQQVARWCVAAIVGMLAAIIVVGACTATSAGAWFTALNLLIFLSYVKLAITLMKYTPQAILNWRRKSTVGWSIENVLLDFTGGSLSLAQTLMDNGVKGTWGAVIGGNPAKFFLGFTSMVFDVVFFTQHYALYKDNNSAIRAAEAAALYGAPDADDDAFDTTSDSQRLLGGADALKLGALASREASAGSVLSSHV